MATKTAAKVAQKSDDTKKAKAVGHTPAHESLGKLNELLGTTDDLIGQMLRRLDPAISGYIAPIDPWTLPDPIASDGSDDEAAANCVKALGYDNARLQAILDAINI